jgi:hypothetical protein
MSFPYIKPLAEATLADVKATLEGLGTGKVYAASDLYQRYRAVMKGQDREPVHAVRFGQMLAEWGALRRKLYDRSKGHQVAAWMI